MFRHARGKLNLFVQLLVVSLLSSGCNEANDRYAPVYQIYADVEVQYLMIDEENIADIHLNPVNPSKGVEVIDFILGGDFLIVKGDSLITVSNARRSIRIVDISIGEEVGQFSYVGRGPGEYQRIDYLLYSDGYFLIIDSNQAKILRFDDQFNFIEELVVSDMFPQSGFTYLHPHLFFPVSNDPDYLIHKRSITQPDLKAEFHRRIISIGKQPSGYNNIIMDLNSDGELLVGSRQMPLLYFYGADSSIDFIIRLQYNDFDREEEQTEFDEGIGQRVLNNPPPVEIETDKIIRGRNILSNLIFSDNEILLIHSGMVTFLKKDGNDYQHWKSIRIFDQNGEPFYPMYMARRDSGVYLSNRFRNYVVHIDPDMI